jgi:hypothetical protein
MAVSEYTHKIAILTRKIWEMDAESLNLEDLDGFGSLFSGKPKMGDPKSRSIRCRHRVLPSTPGTWLGTRIEPAILHEAVKKHLYGGFHK